jgi:hypothetical protein
MSATAPVLVILWRRADLAPAQAQALRMAGVEHLIVCQDGADDAYQRALLDATLSPFRALPCRVDVHRAARHLGLRGNVERALAQVFAEHAAAVILEDDALPHPDFFPFAQALLTRHLNDDSVHAIHGSCVCPLERDAAYVGSRYAQFQGWATWRRAWADYSATLTPAEAFFASPAFAEWLPDRHAQRYWRYVLDRERRAPENWDYAWLFSHWAKRRIALQPTRNLISNVGFRADATHTRQRGGSLAALPLQALPPPYLPASALHPDDANDQALDARLYGGNLSRLLRGVRERIAE